MTARPSMNLPVAPKPWVDGKGTPRFGSYAGELDEVRLSALGPAHAPAFPNAVLRRKRWHYSLVGTPEVLVVMAVANLGYAANGFLAAVDLGSREKLIDASYLGVPGPLAAVSDHPGPGLHAELWGAGGHLHVRRAVESERYQLESDILSLRQGRAKLRAEVLVAGAPPALTVIAPVPEGVVNVTQKHAGLLAFGSFEVGGRRYELDGGVAGMDYTQGLLARQTSWRWAMGVGRLADGRPVGFNVVEGFNEADPNATENALWLDGRLIPLPRATFTYEKRNLLAPWTLRTSGGEVDLSFSPIHVHQDVRDFKVIKSEFYQPLGVFSGTVKVEGHTFTLERIPGVTEDQNMLW